MRNKYMAIGFAVNLTAELDLYNDQNQTTEITIPKRSHNLRPSSLERTLQLAKMASNTESESDMPNRCSKKSASMVNKVGAQKFTKKTKAFVKLKKMFENKDVLASDRPADVRSKDILFQDFTTQQF
jgi:hypothetical protein